MINLHDVAELPNTVVRNTFQAGARLRHARVFHPRGVQLAGRFRANSAYVPWFGPGDRAVIARQSKGVGSPGGVPDVLGLAFRVLDRDENPWDFTLATTGTSALGRFVITPSRAWSTARFGTLLPYRFADRPPVWLFAEPLDPDDLPDTASLRALDDHLDDQLIRFSIIADGIGRPPEIVGELDLRRAEPGEYRTDFFDPILNHPDDVALMPQVVNWLRESAYTGSRRGRTDDNAQPAPG